MSDIKNVIPTKDDKHYILIFFENKVYFILIDYTSMEAMHIKS